MLSMLPEDFSEFEANLNDLLIGHLLAAGRLIYGNLPKSLGGKTVI